jgi:predicted TIM-barrel enzyme
MVFDFLGNKKKAVIAMAHIGALPGSPGYDTDGGLDKLVEGVLNDVRKLQAGGVDAVMFGNENDRPYVLRAPPEGLAAMTAIVEQVKPHLKVPFGVNYLWDPEASVAIGAVTGARFVREIFTGVFASDMGVWQPDCAKATRLRHALGRDDMKMLFNINAEFSYSVNQSDLRRVSETVKDRPVFANTGVNKDNVADILSIASGVIVGTHFKIDGDTWSPVDAERVKRFMAIVESLR